MSTLNVLIVDDETAIRQVLTSKLIRAEHVVESVGEAEAALELLSRGDFDACLCDIRLPGMDGIALLRKAKEAEISTKFIMMTAYASVETAIDAMKEGAFDYLTKPLRHDDVLHRLSQIAQVVELSEENQRLRSEMSQQVSDRFESQAGVMLEVERMIQKVAPTIGTVLITGESGTGKSFVARKIHEYSTRSDKPFLFVNCGAIPEHLLESEFFGHTKGAFTGAYRAKRGLFREADGGTLLLDEVSELPPQLQVKLLHALEEREVRPVGSEQARHIDVRILAASNRDLPAMIREGSLREDLYYRLNVFQIEMPPLRNRREDIPGLIRFLIARESKRLGIEQPLGIDPVAEEVLTQSDWPGNLRELQNVIARALVMADGEQLLVSDLPLLSDGNSRSEKPSSENFSAEGSLRDRVRLFEMEQVRQALEQSAGDRREAARTLGIGLSTLYRKQEDFGIESDDR
ncbi:MAG: sigma-54-dependent Fis family transcriptional regulator [Deltaproteobacteria bacterium]|nr:sigma-54-dependent Fis family transcriptional regulator [Deltaproteobacteria bacterium]MBW2724312.1 sigma-54-dependent Fis family transcriptional regulator [Deltaproteobacteria bacterium]